jgi:hypothetical protein
MKSLLVLAAVLQTAAQQCSTPIVVGTMPAYINGTMNQWAVAVSGTCLILSSLNIGSAFA